MATVATSTKVQPATIIQVPSNSTGKGSVVAAGTLSGISAYIISDANKVQSFLIGEVIKQSHE